TGVQRVALPIYPPPAGAVGVGKPAHVMAAQHPIDGGASHAEVVAEPVGTLATAAPSNQHPTDLAGRQGMRTATGSRAPVGQPGLTMLAVAAQPLVGGCPHTHPP